MKTKIALSILVVLLVTSCEDAAFKGDAGKKRDNPNDGTPGDPNAGGSGVTNQTDDATNGGKLPFGTPPTPNLETPGWIGEEAKNDFTTLFDTATSEGDGPGIGGDPGTGTPGTGGDPGTGTPGIGTDGGTSPGGGLFEDTDGILWIPCDARDAAGDFYGRKGTKVRITGEFCPKGSVEGDVTVLFVVDHSGSMEGNFIEGPNDKTDGGSCGRLRAAEALVKEFSSGGFDGTKVKAGLVNFSSDATIKIPVGDIGAIKGQLNAGTFCGSDTPVAKTNYKAAFVQAKAALASVKGTKLIYFISDGSPTAGGNDDHRQAGLDAATELRGLDDVTLFALFVGYKSGSANNPQGYLEDIAGDAANVRVTGSADELVNAIQTIGIPLIKLAPSAVKGSLDNLTGQHDVGIERVKRHPTKVNRFIWATDSFELAGKLNEEALNTLTVSGETSNKVTVEATAKITFHEKP